MKKRRFFGIVILLALAGMALGQGLRKPVWAGQFYDGRAEVLSRRIDAMLAAGGAVPAERSSPLALMVPHAGYVYSGQVAAHAYKLVMDSDFTSVVIIGPAHRYPVSECSVYPRGEYETPLGRIAVDQDLAARIAQRGKYPFVPQAHAEEHCIEVQIPFIQKVLPQARIVPVLVGQPSRKNINKLAEIVTEIWKEKRVLIVVSTDMSHYLSRDSARRVDGETLDLIKKLNCGELIDKLQKRENILCGGAGVAAVLTALKARPEPYIEILKYADSSEAGGPASEVVGYFSAALYSGGDKPGTVPLALSKADKQRLLNLARSAVEDYVKNRPLIPIKENGGELSLKRGAFVTLKKKGRLRGCIGFVEPVLPLSQAVVQAAVYAAHQDPRFRPVTESELDDLHIEISVLTLPQKIQNPGVIEVGRHGLIISQNNRRGLLLPQVPVENDWTQKEFLEQTCLKAGLDKNAWKRGAEIYTFEAVVFAEQRLP